VSRVAHDRRPRARLLLGGALLLLAGAAAGWAIGRAGPTPGPTAGTVRETTPPAAPATGSHGLRAVSTPTSRAIANGLAWLTRVQEPDGSWDLAKWNPHHGKTGLSGFSEEDHWFAPAATGLAALAFLETQSPDAPFPPALARGLDRLVGFQQPDGRIGFDEIEVDTYFREKLHLPGFADHGGPGYKALTIHTFNNAVSAAALAMAAKTSGAGGAGGVTRWREAARKALVNLVADEHPEYRWTVYFDPESDIGVAAYVVLAARMGADAGLAKEAGPLLEAAPDFLDRVTDVESGRTRMQSDHPACFDGDDSTAINAYCRRLLGQAPDSAPLRALLTSVSRADPSWTAVVLPEATGKEMFHAHLGAVVNHDAFTYGVKALAQAPGARGKAWREAVRQLLVGNQVVEGEHAGSWDPIGTWDRVGGRIYATAMAVRALGGP
jgi:hypothetical protein